VERKSLAVNGSFRVNCLCPRLNPMWTMATVIAVTKYGTIGVKMLDLQRRRRGLTGTSTSERPRKGREEARKTC